MTYAKLMYLGGMYSVAQGLVNDVVAVTIMGIIWMCLGLVGGFMDKNL